MSRYLSHKELHLVPSPQGLGGCDFMDHVATGELNRLHREEHVLKAERHRVMVSTDTHFPHSQGSTGTLGEFSDWWKVAA